MSKPLALILLLAVGAGSSGCGERRSEAALDSARQDCPTERSEPDKGSICLVKRGPNWTYAFAYPAEAARIPALDAWLRSQSKADDERDEEAADGLGAIARYAKEYAKENPEGRLFREKVYTLDADLPGLLALSLKTSEYSGGAHGWFTYETLFWDKSRNQALKSEALFSDPSAANAEIRDHLCPVLNDLRRSRNRGFDGRCAGPPYESMALLASDGRVTRLKFTFTELEGYAGGTYMVYVPVTRRLLDLVAERFQPSFALSALPPSACINDLGCGEESPPRAQPRSGIWAPDPPSAVNPAKARIS